MFEEFIKNLISRASLDSKLLEKLTREENMKYFKIAFTHTSVSKDNNYEVFEQLGDISYNKFLVWYFHKRFHNLNSVFGVKIVARLRINYGSKQFIGSLGEKLGFWEYIQIAPSDISNAKKLSVLEDVFESFVGVTEYLIDANTFPGFGYIGIYKILKAIFDEIPIDLSYESLFDSKTRLKELFDVNRETLGLIRYDHDKQSGFITVSRVFQNKTYPLSKIYIEVNKAEAEQRASEEVLKKLQIQGYSREIPEEYLSIITDILEK